MHYLWSAFKSFIGPLLVATYIVYLTYGAFAGAAGYSALKRLESEESVLRAEVQAIRDRREAMQKRADLLNPNSLDPEMMEERIRAVLGYAREGDIVIPREEIDRIIRLQEGALTP
jgi:cell division protein FtsB